MMSGVPGDRASAQESESGNVDFADANRRVNSSILQVNPSVQASRNDLRGAGRRVERKGDWEVKILEVDKNEGFPSNRLTSTKYTLLNWVPKSLFEQFRKVSNFYFLIVAIITLIPGVTSFDPFTAVFPLFCVVAFSIARETYDDVGRRRADNRSNNAVYQVLKRNVTTDTEYGKTEDVKSWQVKVGDIIVLKKNCVIPADCVALLSTEEGGVLYVSTAQLDGETNLKRHGVTQATKHITEARQVSEAQSSVTNFTPPTVGTDDNFHSKSGYTRLILSTAIQSCREPDVSTALSRGLCFQTLTMLTSPGPEYLHSVIRTAMQSADSIPILFADHGPHIQESDHRIIESRASHSMIMFACFALRLVGFFCFLGKVHMLRGELSAGVPNAQFENFQGKLTLTSGGEDGSTEPVPVDTTSLLLRGSVLRNTETVYAVVIYTGRDTKVALNMRNPPSKLSFVDITLNWTVLYIFILLVILVVVYSGLSGYYQVNFVSSQWYQGPVVTDSAVVIGLRSIGTYIVLFSAFIPISLFISLETVRILQGLFMLKDEHMRSSDGRQMVARTSNLNDTLGCVHTILSDKTGTLTKNVMEYVACSVGGEVVDIRSDAEAMKRLADEGDEKVKQLVLAMALCHAVVPDYHGEEEGEVLKVPNYQGASPDEVALVKSAASFGITLLQRSVDNITISRYGTQEEYKMEAELEFNSDRKRMTMIFKCPDGKYRAFTKGADTMMIPRLNAPKSEVTSMNEHLNTFAAEGLRTLVMASKEFDEETFKSWLSDYKRAQLAVEDREEAIAKCAEVIESDMDVVGVTAVEDKLQDEVPETIKFLREAGVALWVLTGDKRETAENIGYSANMLDSSMTVIHVECESEEEMAQVLDDEYRKHVDHNGFTLDTATGIFSMKSLDQIINSKEEETRREKNRALSAGGADNRRLAIIIDGKSLEHVLNAYSKYFLMLTDHCKTVICCRVTPMQKALVVRMVKRLRGVTTLAIGDGGNDVSMIQEADVGVGLFGKEGTQAARSADYAIGEFRLLKRLMCVHGHYNWIRNPGIINLSFYKNVVITMGQVYYQFFCQFTGTSIHNEYVVTVYNVALTLLNPLFFALLEKDVAEKTLLEKPRLYSANRARKLFGKRTVTEYVLGYALWHSIATFWFQYGTLGGLRQINFSVGREAGIAVWGFGLSTNVIIIVLCKMMLVSNHWTIINIAAFVVSLGCHFALVPIYYNVLNDRSLIGVLRELLSSGTFWMTVFVTTTAAFMLDFVVAMIRRFYYPDEILLEQERAWERSLPRRT